MITILQVDLQIDIVSNFIDQITETCLLSIKSKKLVETTRYGW